MAIKYYLERPRKLYQAIKRNEESAAHWHRMASSVSGPSFDSERVSTSRSTNAPFIYPLEKAIDMERTIQQQYGELAELKTEVSATICLLDDGMQQLVLLNRYIRLMSWEDIMVELSMSEYTVFALHRAALKELEVKYDEKDQS